MKDLEGERLPTGALRRFGSVLFKHRLPIRGLIAGPGSLSLSWDSGTAQVWDVRRNRRVFQAESTIAPAVDSGWTVAATAAGSRITVFDVRRSFRTLKAIRAGRKRITRMASTSDGRILAFSAANEVWLAGLRAARPPRRLGTHYGAVTSLVISPDGKLLASADAHQVTPSVTAPSPRSPQSTLRVWRIPDGHLLHEERMSAGSLAFTRDSRLLLLVEERWNRLTPSEPARLVARDPSSGRLKFVVGGAEGIGAVVGVELTSDGRLGLATALNPAGRANRSVLFRAADGRVLRDEHVADAVVFAPHEGTLLGFGICPGDVPMGCEAQLHAIRRSFLVDRKTFRAVRCLLKERVQVVASALHAGRHLIALAGEDRLVRVVHAGSGNPLWTLGPHAEPVRHLAFGEEGKHLAVASGHAIVSWDLSTGRRLRGRHQAVVITAAFQAEGHAVITAGTHGVVWNVTTGRPMASTPLDGFALPSVAAFAKGVARVFGVSSRSAYGISSLSGSATAFRHGRRDLDGRTLEDGGLVGEPTGPTGRLSDYYSSYATLHRLFGWSRLSPDGARLLTQVLPNSFPRRGGGALWEVPKGRFTATLFGRGDETPHLTDAVFDASGRHLVVATWTSPERGRDPAELTLHDAGCGKRLRLLGRQDRPIGAVAVSPSGCLVATGEAPSRVRELSPADEEVPSRSKPRLGPVEVLLWSTATSRPERRLRGHTGDVTALAISADGRRLVSGSVDETVRVWDLSTGRLLRTYRSGSGTVREIRLSRAGRFALSVHANGTALMWGVP